MKQTYCYKIMSTHWIFFLIVFQYGIKKQNKKIHSFKVCEKILNFRLKIDLNFPITNVHVSFL